METYLKAVWEDVFDDIKESIEDPESRQVLKDIMTKAMIKNKGKLPAGASNVNDQAAAVGTKHIQTKTKVVSAYNLHWNDWKEENTEKEYPDPDDESKKLSAHKYWQKHVWPNLDASEKKKYNDMAKDKREQVKKVGGGTKPARRKASKSAFTLYLEKMKDKMGNKDEEFTHPESGDDIKLHRYLLYIWTNYIKKDDDLKEPFETMAKDLKESESDQYDLKDLPYLDPEKLRAGDLDNLEMIDED